MSRRKSAPDRRINPRDMVLSVSLCLCGLFYNAANKQGALMTATDPREILENSTMTAAQITVVAITVFLNALDGFDVLSIAFASPGIAKEWGSALHGTDRNGRRLYLHRWHSRQNRPPADIARVPCGHGCRHARGDYRHDSCAAFYLACIHGSRYRRHAFGHQRCGCRVREQEMAQLVYFADGYRISTGRNFRWNVCFEPSC